MTCIVGIRDEPTGDIWVGSDSCSSNGHTWVTSQHPKVIARDGLLFGICGHWGWVDALRYRLKVPVVPESVDTSRWLAVDFVDAVRAAVKSAGFGEVKDSTERVAGSVLVGFRGHLMLLQSDLSLLPAPDVGIAIGSGYEAATGSLWTTRGQALEPRDRVLIALEAAGATVTTVRGPMRVERLEAQDE